MERDATIELPTKNYLRRQGHQWQIAIAHWVAKAWQHVHRRRICKLIITGCNPDVWNTSVRTLFRHHSKVPVLISRRLKPNKKLVCVNDDTGDDLEYSDLWYQSHSWSVHVLKAAGVITMSAGFLDLAAKSNEWCSVKRHLTSYIQGHAQLVMHVLRIGSEVWLQF